MIQEIENMKTIAKIDPAMLMGEIITWKIIAKEVPVNTLRNALVNNGLDPSFVTELAPRNAFSRACRMLDENRVIRKLEETDAVIVFQFTKEELDKHANQIQYSVETKVTLTKASGTVRVDNGDTQLEGFAQQLINHNIQHRKTGDVTTLVQKMFSTRGDIFSIREQGGAYFVPAELRGFTEQVEKFVEEIGGEMSRFPVPKGTAEGTKAVKHAVDDGLQALLNELNAKVDQFNDKTRVTTLEHHMAEIQTVKQKIEAYKVFLGDRQEYLEHKAAVAMSNLRQKALELNKQLDEETASD